MGKDAFGNGSEGIQKRMAKITDALAGMLRKLTPAEGKPENYFNSAIVVSGGSGTRMGDTGGVPKQLLPLLGKPVIVHTVSAFEESPIVNEIILVAREEDIPAYEQLKADYGWKKVVKIVKGGDSRPESVKNGFLAIDDRSDYVMIHDGARCLVTPDIILRVARSAVRYGAAIAAEAATATVKQTDDKKAALIKTTLDRDKIMLAQTPQTFKTEIYRAALYTTMEKGLFNGGITDDAKLCEDVGFEVWTVDVGPENRKITTPFDLKIAELILRERNEVTVK